MARMKYRDTSVIHSKLYKVWSSMVSRCNNRPNYAGRGISVCAEWRYDFQAFEKWAVSSGYSNGLQIDRINNNGNYEPSNCRWVTAEINCSNRSKSIILETGETTARAAKRLGMSPQALRYRIKTWPMHLVTLSKVPNGGMRANFKRHHGIGKWQNDATQQLKGKL